MELRKAPLKIQERIRAKPREQKPGSDVCVITSLSQSCPELRCSTTQTHTHRPAATGLQLRISRDVLSASCVLRAATMAATIDEDVVERQLASLLRQAQLNHTTIQAMWRTNEELSAQREWLLHKVRRN